MNHVVYERIYNGTKYEVQARIIKDYNGNHEVIPVVVSYKPDPSGVHVDEQTMKFRTLSDGVNYVASLGRCKE